MRAQKRPGATVPVVILSILTACGLAQAQGKEKEPKAEARLEQVALDWKRDPKVRASRETVPVPSPPELPDDMRVAASPTSNAARIPVPPAPPSDPLADRAVRAGTEVANEAARVWGYRQYWRAGFARGFDQAFDDPRSDASDRTDGFRYGHLDPRALLTGQQIAQQSADTDAGRAAEERVHDQFVDLSRMPQRDARPAVRAALPVWGGPFAIAPVLEEVFVAVPLGGSPWLSRDGRAALEGWDVQPATLSRGGRGRTVYEANWKDADRAFVVWREQQRPGSYWFRYGRSERERFRSIFTVRFTLTLASLDLRPTYAGWRIGFEDGWRYGDSVRAEWAYRQGYADGFDAGVRDAAAIAWPFAFDHAYVAAYADVFARWSTTAQPDVAGVRLLDGNDDGVIEPGERLFLEADLVNYGGAPGTFEVRASGAALDGDEVATVTLRARSRSSLDRTLDLHVDAATPNRTRTSVTVTVGDAAYDAPMLVAHPLAIVEDTLVDADYLRGSVRVEVAVANASRRDLEAVVRAAPVGRGGGRLAGEPIRVPAGRSVRASLVAGDIRPLDLIGGHAQWRLTVDRDRGTDDERVVGVREVATDLSNRDLILYMVDLAHERRPARQDVAEARALVLDRMRADWDRARAADGNPYKRDVENDSASTALGDLARTVRNERGGFETRDVFAGLGDDIASLASELPRTHPLLRKWMKRLAKKVG